MGHQYWHVGLHPHNCIRWNHEQTYSWLVSLCNIMLHDNNMPNIKFNCSGLQPTGTGEFRCNFKCIISTPTLMIVILWNWLQVNAMVHHFDANIAFELINPVHILHCIYLELWVFIHKPSANCWLLIWLETKFIILFYLVPQLSFLNIIDILFVNGYLCWSSCTVYKKLKANLSGWYVNSLSWNKLHFLVIFSSCS